MLEESSCLLLNQLTHHVAKNGADCIESLICGADVVQTIVIEQYLLDDEYGHSLTEF